MALENPFLIEFLIFGRDDPHHPLKSLWTGWSFSGFTCRRCPRASQLPPQNGHFYGGTHNGWFGKSHLEMDNLGVPLFQKPPNGGIIFRHKIFRDYPQPGAPVTGILLENPSKVTSSEALKTLHTIRFQILKNFQHFSLCLFLRSLHLASPFCRWLILE